MSLRRSLWVANLSNTSGRFRDHSLGVVKSLKKEIARDGNNAILDHLRVCGAVPEQYSPSSSEEKLYSKYTDAVVSVSFEAIGLSSMVIDARADTADVQARAQNFSLVADAKVFRLSRTARNQKDFKVQSMDSWRNGLDYAIIVGPIYQFLSGNSQIYQQAIARNVCLLSFSHLACLVSLTEAKDKDSSEELLHKLLKTVGVLHPGKSASDYWTAINHALVESLPPEAGIWESEKKLSLEGLQIAKDESLKHLTLARNRLLGLSRQEAIDELLKRSTIDSSILRVKNLQFGSLLER
ncbi:MAG: HindIII family type II restriction endonuclease [Chloroflexota bacterium]|nr:HindIII family type II restriction endonuclease [Chloroflexota bacterium]